MGINPNTGKCDECEKLVRLLEKLTIRSNGVCCPYRHGQKQYITNCKFDALYEAQVAAEEYLKNKEKING